MLVVLGKVLFLKGCLSLGLDFILVDDLTKGSVVSALVPLAGVWSWWGLAGGGQSSWLC